VTSLLTRLKASFIHLVISGVIGSLAAMVVFGVWFPWPYRLMSGGQTLFIIIVSVDLILGPALTLVVYSPAKARIVLKRDLVVIGLLQLAALMYGVHAVFISRPVATVFEERRFRVVADIDVLHSELPLAMPGLQALSWTGPKLLGTRKPNNLTEESKTLDFALKGFDIGTRPSFWQPYANSAQDALKAARPMSQLYKQYPDSQRKIRQQLEKKQVQETNDLSIKFVPVISKEGNWCALLDTRTGAVIDFVPYDGFF
jgi:hypothetical protein